MRNVAKPLRLTTVRSPNMEIRRKTFVEIETPRRISVIIPAAEIAEYCPFCEAPKQPLITAEHAAVMFGISRRTIYRFVEEGAAHFVENADGDVMLCPASLAALTEK